MIFPKILKVYCSSGVTFVQEYEEMEKLIFRELHHFLLLIASKK
jgi:hypothetical protein